MGFLIKYLPTLSELEKLLEQQPEMLAHYLQADTLVGSHESIEYIHNLSQNLIIPNSASAMSSKKDKP